MVDVRLFAQERGGGQNQNLQQQQRQQQEDEEFSQDSLTIEVIPDSLLEGVKIYRFQL